MQKCVRFSALHYRPLAIDERIGKTDISRLLACIAIEELLRASFCPGLKVSAITAMWG